LTMTGVYTITQLRVQSPRLRQESVRDVLPRFLIHPGSSLPKRRRFRGAGQSRQVIRPAPLSNHCSSRVRRPLDGRSSIPNRNSPRMIGSTAISRSWRRSQLTTFGSGRGLVGSLSTFASTRNFTAAHKSLVDSEATSTKNPFSGHESSQSASPSLGDDSQRRSRYSPRSIRSISNSCPGLMSSCCRTAAGRTICPLLEMRVFMLVRKRLTAANSSQGERGG